MSWTVHEDEYKTVEPNLEEILQQVVVEDDEEQMHHQPRPQPKASGRYTKSSQVFAAPSPLAPTDLSTPVKDPMDGVNAWVHGSTPAHSPIPNGHAAPYTPFRQQQQHHHQVQGKCNNMRYQANASMYDRTPKNSSMNYSVSPPAASKRGSHSHMDDHMMAAADARKLAMMVPMDDPDILSGSQQYMDWATPLGGKFQQPTYNNITADSLRGKVYETAKDQHGCRFLQRWLDTNCDPEAVQVIMSEIIPHVAELMTDQYANFLVQKLFDIMPDDVRYNVARVAASKISTIALTPHGTFSVQKMIETISTREEMEIVREALSKDVVRLVKDAHGNHVIQKVLQRFDYADKEFIYEAVAHDCVTIAKNKQGCCVLQRCLEYASPAQKAALVKNILSCCLQIVQDPFGNYVLQYVLDTNDSSINDTIAIAFLPHIVHLCMNKFSSNVMEKVLRGASSHIQEMYVDTICNPEIVTRLIQDDFGNYVLQTALSISSPAQSDGLVAAIRPLMPLIRNAPYAKKLEGKMEAISRKSAVGGGGGGGGGYRNVAEYEPARRHDSAGPKYDRVGGYSHHHRIHEPRPASWQTS